MSTVRQIHLLDDLQSLLEKQIVMVRRSDFRNYETLTEQANSIVDKLVRTKAFGQTKFNKQRERLAELYKQLILMVTVQKDNVDKQLRQINEGKKTLRAYHGNGHPCL